MAPREPTRAQLSSKLAYHANTPSFLLKLQNRMKGIPDEEEEDYDEEFEHVGGGREPIPRRPAIPERPAEDLGSADEDDGDEKPQVVVLKAGKHLTEREAENIRRAEKGLPPLAELEAPTKADVSKDGEANDEKSTGSKSASEGLSFSSSSGANFKSKKRKATSQPNEIKLPEKPKKDGKGVGSSKNPSKKAKKESKTLLSFGDDT